jgi:preprotein translocase subunit SecF
MIELFKKTDIDFVGKRNICFIVSSLAVLIGLIALVQISRGAANLGVDFSGGTAVALKFQNPMKMDLARTLLSKEGLGEAELQEVVLENKLLIRIKKGQAGQMDAKVSELFLKGAPDNPFVVESSTEIGPKVSRKLREDAVLAIALSLLGIILYIAFRFEFRFGIAAAIATLHDVFVLLGIFYLLDKEITLLFVTALLTIAGYSLSDTVVVFDRIREHLQSGKRESLSWVINLSINDILARTFNTGFATLLVVVALFFLGGEVIHDFALTMTLGVLIGTYSSWFIASPLLIVLRREAPHPVAKRA